jgi:hypothetical protein
MNAIRWRGLAVVLALASAARAEDEAHVTRLTAQPAGRPEPALALRLYPAARELKAGNAAGLYYRAIVLMQMVDPPGQADALAEHLSESATKLPRDQAQKTLAAYKNALAEIEIGARRQQAVWDIPIREQGVATQLPEMQELRRAGRLLVLQARLEILQGNHAAAARTLATTLRMSRQVAESGPLISSLIGVACAQLALAEIENWIASDDAPNLYWALTELPDPLIDMRAGLEAEQLWLEAEIPAPLLAAMQTSVLSRQQADGLAKQLGELFDMAGGDARGSLSAMLTPAGQLMLPALASYSQLKQELIAGGRPAELVEAMPVAQVLALRWIEAYRNLLDESILWAARPYPEAKLGIAAFDKRMREVSASPAGLYARMLLPAVGAANMTQMRLTQKIAVLRAIEALRLHAAEHNGKLPASLAEVTAVPVPVDPATGGAFEYRLEGKTAILRPAKVADQFQYELTIEPQAD